MSAAANKAGRRRERGSSLVEVTLALGLMAGVLGSLAGLFVIGAGGVHSGRRSSEALSSARLIVEQMQGWEFAQTYEEFGFDGANSSYTVDTRTHPKGGAWQAKLGPALNGHATIKIDALDATAPPLAGCTQMRIEVTVFWNEGSRQRKVRLSTVKM